MIISLIAAALAVCELDPQSFVQDLNCNGVDVVDEVPVDLTDPQCLSTVNEAGIPYPNADYYYDYRSYGCTVPTADLDIDQDGLAGGSLSLIPGETFPDLQVTLTCDNCPYEWNREQLDTDCDNVGDVCDVCPTVYDPRQEDADADGLGDACDVCPYVEFTAQDDFDADGFGDACDNCPEVPNLQSDDDEDGVGDDCDICWQKPDPDQDDPDMDNIGTACDNCPQHSNPVQADTDEDEVGDACDVCPNIKGAQTDSDGDGLGDDCDICRLVPDGDQIDSDGDNYGDACDVCPALFDPIQADSDLDGVGDLCDSCPSNYDPYQLDEDGNGVGDACQDCLGAGWDPGECAGFAARGGASTCGTPGGTSLLGAVAAAALLLVRRRRDGGGGRSRGGMAWLLTLAFLASCGFIPASEREWRLDPDQDGADWPDDCDDQDPTIGIGPPWFLDEDGDGWGGETVEYSCEAPSTQYTRMGEDCDDADPFAFPGASEICDQIDQNCDGEIDEGFPVYPVYTDADDDGYGGAEAGEYCDAFPGYAWNTGDCDDEDRDAHPNAGERCNLKDDDCDDYIDEAITWTWYPDTDEDFYGDTDNPLVTCEPPEGYVAVPGDCDDFEYTTFPYATERCGDGMDNDCNGVIDDEITRWMDTDGDGFGNPDTARTACDRDQHEVDNHADCDDTDPYKNPAVPEVCDDGIDNDCDDVVDTCEEA